MGGFFTEQIKKWDNGFNVAVEKRGEWKSFVQRGKTILQKHIYEAQSITSKVEFSIEDFWLRDGISYLVLYTKKHPLHNSIPKVGIQGEYEGNAAIYYILQYNGTVVCALYPTIRINDNDNNNTEKGSNLHSEPFLLDIYDRPGCITSEQITEAMNLFALLARRTSLFGNWGWTDEFMFWSTRIHKTNWRKVILYLYKKDNIIALIKLLSATLVAKL